MKAKNNLKTAIEIEADKADSSSTRPMVSLEASKATLNYHGISYTDEEILIIREFIYRMAEITTAYYQRFRPFNISCTS